MGVRDLNYLIKRFNRTSIREMSLHGLKGKRIAIDIQLYIYKALIQGRCPIEYIHTQILHLERCRIIPIYVFDGKPPVEKMDEIHRRQVRRSRSLEVIRYLETTIQSSLSNATTPVAVERSLDMPTTSDTSRKENVLLAKIDELKRNVVSIQRKTKQSVRYLCNIMGVQYVEESEYEADQIIGMMYRNGEIDGCISEDNDMLVYGCDKLYRFYKLNSNYIVEYDLPSILGDLDITREQFVDLCILCGNDYYKKFRYTTTASDDDVETTKSFEHSCETTKSFEHSCETTNYMENSPLKNSVLAYYLIKKYHCIETINTLKKSYIPSNMDYERIREIYTLG